MKILDKIYPNFDAATFFETWFYETWFYETQSEDNFEERMGFDEEKCLEEFKEQFSFDNYISINEIDESSKKFQAAFEKYRHKELQDKAQDWYYDRLNDFEEQLENVGQVTEKGIVCARAITVKDREEYIYELIHQMYPEGFSGLGRCWSWDHDKAESHWGNGDHSYEVILKALIPFSAIDKKLTLILNFNPSLGEDEAEIRVKEGKSLVLIAVDDEELERPIKLKA